jgi:hypothetical protein
MQALLLILVTSLVRLMSVILEMNNHDSNDQQSITKLRFLHLSCRNMKCSLESRCGSPLYKRSAVQRHLIPIGKVLSPHFIYLKASPHSRSRCSDLLSFPRQQYGLPLVLHSETVNVIIAPTILVLPRGRTNHYIPPTSPAITLPAYITR